MKKIKKIALILTCFCLLKNAAYAMENTYKKDIYEEKKETTINTEEEKNKETEINTEKEEEKKEPTINKDEEKEKLNTLSKNNNIILDEKENKNKDKDEEKNILNIIKNQIKLKDEKEANLINNEKVNTLSKDNSIIQEKKEKEIKTILTRTEELLIQLNKLMQSETYFDIQNEENEEDYIFEDKAKEIPNEEDYIFEDKAKEIPNEEDDIFEKIDIFCEDCLKIIPIAEIENELTINNEYLNIVQNYPSMYKTKIKEIIPEISEQIEKTRNLIEEFSEKLSRKYDKILGDLIEKNDKIPTTYEKEELIKQINKYINVFAVKIDKLKNLEKTFYSKIKEFEKFKETLYGRYRTDYLHNKKEHIYLTSVDNTVLTIYDYIASVYSLLFVQFKTLYDDAKLHDEIKQYDETKINDPNLVTEELKKLNRLKNSFDKITDILEEKEEDSFLNYQIKNPIIKNGIFIAKDKIDEYIDNCIGKKGLTNGFKQIGDKSIYLNKFVNIINDEDNKEKIYKNKELEEFQQNLFLIEKALKNLHYNTQIREMSNLSKLSCNLNKIKTWCKKYNLQDLYGARLNYISDMFNDNIRSANSKLKKILANLKKEDPKKYTENILFNTEHIKTNLIFFEKLKNDYDAFAKQLNENMDFFLKQNLEIIDKIYKEIEYAKNAAISCCNKILDVEQLYGEDIKEKGPEKADILYVENFHTLIKTLKKYYNYFLKKEDEFRSYLKTIELKKIYHPEKLKFKVNEETLNNFNEMYNEIKAKKQNLSNSIEEYKKYIKDHYYTVVENLNQNLNKLINKG